MKGQPSKGYGVLAALMLVGLIVAGISWMVHTGVFDSHWEACPEDTYYDPHFDACVHGPGVTYQ